MPQIGMGWKLEVNDGAAAAYAVIDAITDLTVPDDGPFGMAESKRLDITGKTVTRVVTVKTPGAFTFTYEFDKDQYVRLALLKGTVQNWRASSVDATPWTRVVPGTLTQQEISGVQADGIVSVACTVEVSGAAT